MLSESWECLLVGVLSTGILSKNFVDNDFFQHIDKDHSLATIKKNWKNIGKNIKEKTLYVLLVI